MKQIETSVTKRKHYKISKLINNSIVSKFMAENGSK